MTKSAAVLLALSVSAAAAEQSVEYSVRGLFQRDRKAALIAAAQSLENCRLVDVDYEHARATFVYDDEAQGFKKAKPEQVLQQIDTQVRKCTKQTMTIVPPSPLSEEALQRIDFVIEGLDCLGCSYGAYSTVATIDGVVRAYASFHDGTLTAFIDPSKTNRESLAEILKKREIKIVDHTATQKPDPKN
jgi:hypothetical protein